MALSDLRGLAFLKSDYITSTTYKYLTYGHFSKIIIRHIRYPSSIYIWSFSQNHHHVPGYPSTTYKYLIYGLFPKIIIRYQGTPVQPINTQYMVIIPKSSSGTKAPRYNLLIPNIWSFFQNHHYSIIPLHRCKVSRSYVSPNCPYYP